MAGLPKKVRVGYGDWDIVLVPRATIDGDLGEFDYDAMQISVADDQVAAQEANTLLHETLHAVWHAYAMEDQETEEKVVTAFANGLQQVLRDSPAFARWFSKTFCGGKLKA